MNNRAFDRTKKEKEVPLYRPVWFNGLNRAYERAWKKVLAREMRALRKSIYG